jgi:hypothetical protein
VPPLQVAVEFVGAWVAQLFPQAPQLATSVAASDSQPVAGLLSQLLKPAAQVRPQFVPSHVAVEFGPEGQTVPQLPQLDGVFNGVSQPLDPRSLSQLPKPALQVIAQVPVAQDAVALAGAVHGVPQAPQSGAVVNGVSQPSLALALQSPKPAWHVKRHVPVAHDAVALAGAVQGVPQPPQLVSVVSATQVPLQHVCPLVAQLVQLVPQASLLVLATHVLPLGQVPAGQTQAPLTQTLPLASQLVQLVPQVRLPVLATQLLPLEHVPAGQTQLALEQIRVFVQAGPFPHRQLVLLGGPHRSAVRPQSVLPHVTAWASPSFNMPAREPNRPPARTLTA